MKTGIYVVRRTWNRVAPDLNASGPTLGQPVKLSRSNFQRRRKVSLLSERKAIVTGSISSPIYPRIISRFIRAAGVIPESVLIRGFVSRAFADTECPRSHG